MDDSNCKIDVKCADRLMVPPGESSTNCTTSGVMPISKVGRDERPRSLSKTFNRLCVKEVCNDKESYVAKPKRWVDVEGCQRGEVVQVQKCVQEEHHRLPHCTEGLAQL